MLYEALLLLEHQLNAYFEKQNTAGVTGIFTKPAELNSIVAFTEEDLRVKETIFITVLNISEEGHFKNAPLNRKETDLTRHQSQPASFTFDVLFCVCIKEYKTALLHLSHVISFFREKNMFIGEKSFSGNNAVGQVAGYKFTLDLCSLTLEQANDLWGTLGGRQYPYALYKARLVEGGHDKALETKAV